MQFKQGAEVYTADGERAGTIKRIVIEPDTKEVTNLVIQKGILFTEDKVIPISLVNSSTEDRVKLRKDGGDLTKFPDFEVSHYIPADRGALSERRSRQLVRPMFWYPPIGGYNGFAVYDMPPYVRKEENIPEGTVAIEEGADVISSDGEHVGDVERVFTEPEADRATHLLISKGLLLKEKKLIPTRWLTHVFEHEVRLSVEADLVKSLPEYNLVE